MPPSSVGRRAALAAPILLLALLPGVARAQTVDLTVSLAPAPAPTPPLQSGLTGTAAATLTVNALNTSRLMLPLRHLTFSLPTGYAFGTGSAGPSGWTPTITGQAIEFRAPCTDPGILPQGGSGAFQIAVTPPGAARASDASEALTLTNAGDDYCSGIQTWTPNTLTLPFVRRFLSVAYVSATAPAVSGMLATATVTWRVTNLSNARKNPVTVTGGAGTPGITATCTPTLNLRPAAGGTVTCTYGNIPLGTHVLAAGASASGVTAMGASTSVTVSAASHVDWARPVAVTGRTPPIFSITVVNASAQAVDRVEIPRPANWTGGIAVAGDASLIPATGCSADAPVCFRGTLAGNGGRTVLQFQFSGAPTVSVNTPQTFQVRARNSLGTYTFSQQVMLVAPLPEVAGFTVLSDAGGQLLSWRNTGRTDSPHAGVVVFRSQGTPPGLPQDFTDYTAGGSFLAGGPAVRDLADPALGAYFYRVCNRDAYFVYSSCRALFWNNAGYADSIAIAGTPARWSHQLGGEALQAAPTILPGGRVAIATNRPDLAILDLATGIRSFDPVPLLSLPSSSMPWTQLADGRQVLFAADASGTVTAVNLATGQLAWQRTISGESFLAGVSGITRAHGHAAFQAAYPMDVLLLGSVSTGNVLAIDAGTGDTLWTINVAPAVRALITYDSSTNRFYVPTAGSGVLAFDLTGSGPAAATPARPLSGWQNPNPTGTYSLYCARAIQAGTMACIDRNGLLQVFDGTTGTVSAALATGLTSPGTLVKITSGVPGFVIGNARRVQRIDASGTSALALLGDWVPPGSATVSSALVLSVSGYIIVAGSDGSLHRLTLADASPVPGGVTPALPSATSGAVQLGAIAYDVANRLYVFGTREGRVWAIPF